MQLHFIETRYEPAGIGDHHGLRNHGAPGNSDQCITNLQKLDEAQMQALRDRMKPFVKEGENEPYKITTNFDNKPAAFAPPYEA